MNAARGIQSGNGEIYLAGGVENMTRGPWVISKTSTAFGRDAQLRRMREEPHQSFRFEHNIVCWKEGKLLDGNWNPEKVSFDNNLYWREDGGKFPFGKLTWDQGREKGMDRNSLIADPLFVDVAKKDFRLKADSPALKLGFEPQPIAPKPRH